jgi:MazG family protein
MTDSKEESPIDRLLGIMARLRDPKDGCPWDREQSFATIAPYTIEEAYEVADAIERGDMAALKDELGDLLFQVVFYAQMAGEQRTFDFDDIASAIADKMVERHPHVFGDVEMRSADAQTHAWEAQKALERAQKAKTDGGAAGILDGVAQALPALTRALKLQRRAAREGFDWPDLGPVLAKIDEELAEVRVEVAEGGVPARLADEVGDLLFACVNLARHLKIDPEDALRKGNSKFERRFRSVEAALARDGRTPSDATLEEMDELWEAAKRAENRAEG